MVCRSERRISGRRYKRAAVSPDIGRGAPCNAGHLPVWSEGNVYFNGAGAYRAEVNGRVDTEHTVSADVEYTDGRWVLRTDLYEHLTQMSCRMIDSDILGKAFEPEQRFENPDGTTIAFDTDYFGDHRGCRVIPGPFAAPVKEATAVRP